MLKCTIIFALISLVAGALGFGGIAAGPAGIAKIFVRPVFDFGRYFCCAGRTWCGRCQQSVEVNPRGTKPAMHTASIDLQLD